MPAATEGLSRLEQLATLPKRDRDRLVSRLTDREIAALLSDWRIRARPKQLPPEGDWRLWVIRTGRSWGKTRAGAEWVHEAATEAKRYIALIAGTPADARDYMIEGPSGICTLHPEEAGGPSYEPSKRRLTWPNGSVAVVFSAQEPDQVRGFSGDRAWLDEFAKWPNPREVWENLEFALREASSDRPRVLVTTTPRPLSVLKELEALPSTRTVTGSSYENVSNLAPSYFEDVIARHEGTHLGRQEIHGEILDEVQGAIVTRGMIEELRRTERTPEDMASWMERVVVAVDPAVTAHAHSDETGIIVCGKGEDAHGYTLADRSGRLPPDTWARKVVEAYHEFTADRVVAEVNNGGDLVERMLRLVDPTIPFTAIRASRGKAVRAEPVLAMYERKEVHHVGSFPELEDQLICFTPQGYQGEGSPDRADALVYALSELMLGRHVPSVAPVGLSSRSRWKV